MPLLKILLADFESYKDLLWFWLWLKIWLDSLFLGDKLWDYDAISLDCFLSDTFYLSILILANFLYSLSSFKKFKFSLRLLFLSLTISLFFWLD